MKLTREELLLVLKNTLFVVAGTLILAFGTSIFLFPMNIVSGGVSGLSIIIKLLIPWEIITVDMIVFVLTWVMFFVGLFVLGKAFALKTLLSAIVYPLAVSLFLRLVDPSVLNGFFCLTENPHKDLALILAACVGGVFVGCGCALTFLGGGSTGGVDILAFSICKFFPRLKSSAVIFAVDASTVLLGMFVIGDLVISLLGVLSAFLAAMMVDKVFLGGRAAFVAYVITDAYEQINRSVIERMNRTTTIVEATGGYSNQEKRMLIISFTMSQYAALLAIVGKHDAKAFVMIHRVHEINGEGWGKLK